MRYISYHKYNLLQLRHSTGLKKGYRSIKPIFLCSSGNPIETLISLASLQAILDYEGIVAVDEACIDPSDSGRSAIPLFAEYDADARQKLWASRNMVPHALLFSMLSSDIPQRPHTDSA
jgi:histidinol-phosphate/aromatic aminotransferase/cobyric acid decarboxylase-like protein